MTESRARLIVERLSEINPYRFDPGATDVPRPIVPTHGRRTPIAAQVAAAQRVITQLEYNFLPQTFFSLQKNRPLRNLINAAQEILAEGLPIRCLEATFLAVHLTHGIPELDRFPLAFKSVCNGQSYRHIVLVVRHKGCYGALGLSRVRTLMDKPIVFPSLVDLLDEYAACYAAHGHALASVKLGLCFSRDPLSRQVPYWRFVSLAVPKLQPSPTGICESAQNSPERPNCMT